MKRHSPWAFASQHPLRRGLRGPIFWGVVIIVLFFGGLGGWAAVAPLAGAVLAPGVVAPADSRKTVQHLEGGIIQDLRVRDGDRVAAGDVLLVLESISARANYQMVLSRARNLLAREARLRAERDNADSITFTHPLLADRSDPEVAKILKAQDQHFASRTASWKTRAAVLNQRIEQLQQQINGFKRQITSVRKQRKLIELELKDVQVLIDKQLARRARLLALQRRQAELLGNQGEFEARVARTKEAIGETKLRLVSIEVERVKEIDTDLADVQSRIAEFEERMAQSLDILTRTEIKAPVSGTVIGLQYKTLGGVIGPGAPILDVVPADDSYVIDAQISPTDIDDVLPGQAARIVFSSYNVRTNFRVEGSVRSVSADALHDERTGVSYYLAKIEVNRVHLEEVAPEIELQPGLPADVFIATIDRSVLDFFIQPFVETVRKAFAVS